VIVLNNSAPVLIPTTEDFFIRTTALKESLSETRTKYSLDSSRYQHSLCFVLQELYELVGRPVIENLHKLGIPEQSVVSNRLRFVRFPSTPLGRSNRMTA
jgi:hypothetical protein